MNEQYAFCPWRVSMNLLLKSTGTVNQPNHNSLIEYARILLNVELGLGILVMRIPSTIHENPTPHSRISRGNHQSDRSRLIKYTRILPNFEIGLRIWVIGIPSTFHQNLTPPSRDITRKHKPIRYSVAGVSLNMPEFWRTSNSG